MKIWVSLWALLLFPSVFLHAQTPATLAGTLTDPSGAAIQGAEVSAQPRLGRGPLVGRRTDSDGRFALVLPPGRYLVRVAHPAFARIEREFVLAPGEVRPWNVQARLERLAATVVVSAQAEPAFAETVSSAVTVLTREEMERRQAVWLAPLLETTPGFAFTRLGREGGVTTLFLNGGNSNFTKVLVDGAPFNEPGGFVDFSGFTLDNVEKVEVVRGAESALYGSDAMAGVVQVFTRRGSPEPSGRPALELLAEGGKFSSARGFARLSGVLGRFDYSAAAARFETEGQGPNDAFRNTTLSGNFGWRLTDAQRVRLTLRSNASDAGVQGQTLFTPPDLDEHDALRNFTASLNWQFQTGARWHHTLAGTETYLRQLFDNPGSEFCFSTPPFLCDFPFTVRNQFNRAGFSEQSSYFSPRGGVTLGYQYEVENGFLEGFHARRNNQAGYVEARLRFAQRLTLSAGARAEDNDSFGTRVVPRAGLAYAVRLGNGFWGATRLRGSFGLGIKEPAMDQSFSRDPCFPGNLGLRPERSRSFGFGADQLLAADRVRVSADYFDNRFRDIVSFTFCAPGGPCPIGPPPGCPFGFGTFFNTDLARARGGTATLEARPARWLSVMGNYSYVPSRVLQAPNASDPTLVPGNRLFKRPVHSGNLVLNAGFRRMNWNLAGIFVGRRTDSDFLSLRLGDACFGPCLTSNPGYARVDLAASYELRHGVTAFGRVENLLDKQYQDSLGYLALRRYYRVGMKFLLGGT